MAISPAFRRRHADRGTPVQGNPDAETPGFPAGLRRHQPELVLGLYREIYQMCLRNGIGYCVAAMDSHFGRLLTALGFPFVPVGPANENYKPVRRVYLISAVEIERSLARRENELLEFMQAQAKSREPAREPAPEAIPLAVGALCLPEGA